MPTNQEFDEPQEVESETSGGFTEPPEPAEDDELDGGMEGVEDEDAAGAEGEELPVEEADEEDAAVAEDDAILQCKTQIEEHLCSSAAHAEGIEVESFEGAGNIVGVGVGVAEEDSCCTLGVDPGAPVLNVYVTEAVRPDEVQSVLVDSMGVKAAGGDDVPVNMIVSGPIEAQPHRFKIRPAPGGVSVGHIRITAGTLGCLSRARHRLGGCDKGKYGDRRRRLLILSNNHVLANSNRAKCLDPILQPGPADGGKYRRDLIALLERWQPIRFGTGKVNYVDCAVGWAWPKRVRRQLIYIAGGRRKFFRISSRVVRCRRGLLVGKTGRTTQLTRGRVVDCSWSGWVNYGTAGRAFYRDQLVVRGLGGNFSAGGDSGSVIWTWDRRRNPVGLLFAGGGGLTIANKMPRVLRALDIRLYT